MRKQGAAYSVILSQHGVWLYNPCSLNYANHLRVCFANVEDAAKFEIQTLRTSISIAIIYARVYVQTQCACSIRNCRLLKVVFKLL